MCIIFEPHPLPHSECTLDSFPPVLVPPTGRCKRRNRGRDTSANSQKCFRCFLKMGDVNRKYLCVSWWNSLNFKERRFNASFIIFFDIGCTGRSFFVVVVVLGNEITRSRPIITATCHPTAWLTLRFQSLQALLNPQVNADVRFASHHVVAGRIHILKILMNKWTEIMTHNKMIQVNSCSLC